MSGIYLSSSLFEILIQKLFFPLALSPRSALIFGATGQAGRHLLQSLLASPHFTRVGEYGRKVTSPSDIKIGKDKLEQKVIDFEKIQDYGLKQGKWDVVFITYVRKFFRHVRRESCGHTDLLLFFEL